MRVQAQSKHEEAGKYERKLRTGAETDTYPKDGENIRSSRLSADLAKRTRKWPTEKSSGRTRRCMLLCRQRVASHGKRRSRRKDKEEKKTVSRECPSPVQNTQSEQLFAAHTQDGACALSASSPPRPLTARVFTVRSLSPVETRGGGGMREKAPREQRQTHPPMARTFAAASCRQTWRITRKRWPTE